MNPRRPTQKHLRSNHNTPLACALDWWAGRDDLGGFRAVAAELFPGWRARPSGRAPHRTDRKSSFAIFKNTRGNGEWRFKDHGTGEHGSLVGFVMLAGRGRQEASRWLMDRAEMTNDEFPNDEGMTKPEARNGGTASNETLRHSDFVIRASSFPPMPADVMALWNEGVDYLEAHPESVREIAVRRGWPEEFARYLAECAAISMPLYHGRRGVAFLVSAPCAFQAGVAFSQVGGASPAQEDSCPDKETRHEAGDESNNADSRPENTRSIFPSSPPIPSHGRGGRNGIVMRDIGFHIRLQGHCDKTRDRIPPGYTHCGKPPSRMQRAAQELEDQGWRYMPGGTPGRSTPSLPFILGGEAFDTARLLVITEGQWDALTFALAAGWLGEGCRWPEGVCVIGIRGAASVNAFLEHYEPFWPREAECLLMPDGDAAGSRWTEGTDSFSMRLKALCREVHIARCGRSHKDFNDLYCAEKIGPPEITQLLAEHNIKLETKETL